MSSYKNLEALVEKYINQYQAISLVLESVQQERDEYRDLYSASHEKLEKAERERDFLKRNQELNLKIKQEMHERFIRAEAEVARLDKESQRLSDQLGACDRQRFDWLKRALTAEAEIARRDAAAGERAGVVTGYAVNGCVVSGNKLSIGDHVYTAASPAVLPPEKITEIMQGAWNEFCDDTGCYPDDFEYQNEQLFFDAGRWAMLVAERISSMGAQQQKVVVLEDVQSEAILNAWDYQRSVFNSLDAANVKWEVKK